MIDRIDAYSAFLKMMELGSLSAAVRALGIGQSTVSKHITGLDGVQHCYRTTRQLRPTWRRSGPLCPRSCGSEPVHLGRSGGRLHRRTDAALPADRGAVLAADRLHGDDTTVPVLAKGKVIRAGSGPMCATTGVSADRHRRPLSSIIPGNDGASIPSVISKYQSNIAMWPSPKRCRKSRKHFLDGGGNARGLRPENMSPGRIGGVATDAL